MPVRCVRLDSSYLLLSQALMTVAAGVLSMSWVHVALPGPGSRASTSARIIIGVERSC